MDHLERQRYIEYFQRQLMREGLDSYWQGYEDWFDRNRATIAEQYRAIAKHEIANEVIAHQNKGEYDNFFSRQIFEPMVKKVLEICEEEGFPLRNPVSFVNSPAAEPSPAALPSSAEHLLFIGPSTFAFCNYWSKVFSSAMAEVGTLSEEERKSPEAMISKLKQGQVLVDAARLALRYAHFESLLGFGHIEQSKELVGFRTLLLNAMEVFIIGHEIGHFIGHELHPKTAGIPPGLNSQDHELECDGVGLFVSTVYGVREGNAFAFQLIGPLLLFYAFRTCEQVRKILYDIAPEKSDSHPSNEERFRFTLDFLDSVGANEEIKESVQFALDVAMCVGSQVQLLAHDIKASITTNGE